jgi:hypothetical protein
MAKLVAYKQSAALPLHAVLSILARGPLWWVARTSVNASSTVCGRAFL